MEVKNLAWDKVRTAMHFSYLLLAWWKQQSHYSYVFIFPFVAYLDSDHSLLIANIKYIDLSSVHTQLMVVQMSWKVVDTQIWKLVYYPLALSRVYTFLPQSVWETGTIFSSFFFLAIMWFNFWERVDMMSNWLHFFLSSLIWRGFTGISMIDCPQCCTGPFAS